MSYPLRSSNENQASHRPCAAGKIFLQFTGSLCFVPERRIIFLLFVSPVIPVAMLEERSVVFFNEFPF